MDAEWFHALMHGAQSQIHDVKLELWGHVSAYDPEHHTIRAVIPQYRDEETDEEFETGWIPLGTIMVGPRIGIQYAPQGDEKVKITVMHRQSGHWVGAELYWDDVQQPPGTGEELEEEDDEEEHGDPSDPDGINRLEPGEWVMRLPTGSFIKHYQNGNTQLYAAQDLLVYAQRNVIAVLRTGDLTATVEEGDATVDVQEGNITLLAEQGDILAQTAQGDITVQAAGSVDITGATDVDISSGAQVNISAPQITAALDEETAQHLCNTVFMAKFNTHTHTCPAGQSSPPTPQAVEGVDTTVDFFAG